jgi:hypothetical protein
METFYKYLVINFISYTGLYKNFGGGYWMM